MLLHKAVGKHTSKTLSHYSPVISWQCGEKNWRLIFHYLNNWILQESCLFNRDLQYIFQLFACGTYACGNSDTSKFHVPWENFHILPGKVRSTHFTSFALIPPLPFPRFTSSLAVGSNPHGTPSATCQHRYLLHLYTRAHSTLCTLPLYTLHSTLCTLNLKLHTVHPTLQALHSTLYTSHFTLDTPHSTLYTLHFTLHALHFTLRTLRCTLHALDLRVCTLHFTLHTPHSTLHTLHFTLHTFHLTPHTLHFTLYTFHSELYTLHMTLRTLHFTLHTLHFTLHAFNFTPRNPTL